MFAGKTPEQYEHENGRSSFNLEDTIRKLEHYQRDFFLVFAHVEAPNGLWSAPDGAELEGSDPKCIEEIGQGKACYLSLVNYPSRQPGSH